MDPPPPSAPSSTNFPSVWDLFGAILKPEWAADWYRTHDLHGGGGVFSPLLTLWLLLPQRLSSATTQ